eukprot:GHVU01124301.1.p2 GENE.GHVU01124301.1~~GHVU01124301.1.p2  ORF type:complete len:122 (+),score=19.53 GHVU01124301.1:625-990(+)
MATEQAASLPLLLLCRHSPRLSTPEAGPASAQRLEGCDSPRLTPSAEEGFQRGARGGGREGWVREELVEVAERVREEHLHRVRLLSTDRQIDRWTYREIEIEIERERERMTYRHNDVETER